MVINLCGTGSRQLAPEKQRISKDVVRDVLQWATNCAKPETLVCIRHLKLILKILYRPSLQDQDCETSIRVAILQNIIFLVIIIHLCTSQSSMWAHSNLQTLCSFIFFILKGADDALEDLYRIWCQTCLEGTDFEYLGQGLISPGASWFLGQLTSAEELGEAGGYLKPSGRPQEKTNFQVWPHSSPGCNSLMISPCRFQPLTLTSIYQRYILLFHNI